MTSPRESAIGLAPMTATSFMVPATERLPMSPPGKNMGFTVWESVVKTMSSMTAESSSASSGISPLPVARCFRMKSEINSFITSPPAPCDIFKRMLVPLDGSPESAAILPCVEQFARLHDAEVILFHDSACDSGDCSDGLKVTHIRAMLEQHSVRLANAGLRVRLDWTSYRHPIREILNTIDSLCIDVVAMTTHTGSERDEPLEESVTADVIRHAGCPLLVWACAHCSDQGMT